MILEQTVSHLIQKHQQLTRKPAQRFAYLQQIAQQLNIINFPGKVIQIAGTNGKGSTQHILCQLLQASGFSCHVYRSPHLIKINERFVFNNQMIGDQQLLENLNYIDQHITQPIGFFALLTLAFFKCCCEQTADFILLETGLGGEYDATNILADHALSMITPISYDHCDVLGNTLTDIANAKAGIMRPNRPCFVGLQEKESGAVLQQHAKQLQTPLHYLKQSDYQLASTGFHLQQQNYTTLALFGDHQKDNAALALLAYQHLIPTAKQLSHSQIQNIFAKLHFPGRLHPIKTGYIQHQLKHDLWIDGAHNPAGAKQLIPFLTAQKDPVYLWVNFKNNKDIQTILKTIAKHCHSMIFQATYLADRVEKNDIIDICSNLNIQLIYADNMQEGIYTLNKKPKGLVLAFGSLHWIGDLLKASE